MSVAETVLLLFVAAAFTTLLYAEIRAGVAGVTGGVIRRAVCVEGYWISVAAQAIAGILIAALVLHL